MGFSMHLMCFPGYYSVCLINIHSFILKTLLGGRQQYASILHMENWGTGKLLKVVNVLSQSIFFKVLLSLKSAAAIDSEYSMVPLSAGKWTRRIWHPGAVCGSGRCHTPIHTDPSLVVTPKHSLFCPGPRTCSCPTSFFPSHTSEVLFFVPKAVLSVPVSLLSKS